MKILCPICGRVLGDTSKSIDANLNCRNCRKAVRVRVELTKPDEFYKNLKEKEKSK